MNDIIVASLPELPPDHFWISEKAEEEYFAVKAGIGEAQARFMEAENRLVIYQAILHTFSEAVDGSRCINYYGARGSGFYSNGLSFAFNPWWIDREGTILGYGYDKVRKTLSVLAGNLVLQKVDRRTILDEQPGTAYSYEKRVEWYVPRGEARICHLEYNLRLAKYPFLVHWSLYDKLLEEIIKEVRQFYEAIGSHLVVRFLPETRMPRIEEKEHNFLFIKFKTVEVTPAPPARELTVGTRMLDSKWTLQGKWIIYQFNENILSDFVNNISHRLQKSVMAEAREVVRVTSEIERLNRQLEKIRVLNHKPLVVQQIWSLMGINGLLPEGNNARAGSDRQLRNSAAPVQVPQIAASREAPAANR